MNQQQLKQARQLLGLNQTDFAAMIGWTSKRNVVSLEGGEKKITTQTALAVECLLRRENKYGEFEMIEKMRPVLEFILDEIKRVNSTREDGQAISNDDTNEELAGIFNDAANKFADFDFELIDDEDALIALFGYDGYCSIREAEQGDC